MILKFYILQRVNQTISFLYWAQTAYISQGLLKAICRRNKWHLWIQ